LSETAALLGDAATRMFQEHLDEAAVRRAAQGHWLEGAWAAVEAMGLPLALVPEAGGGFGLDPLEAFALVRLAGACACPLPLGETLVANRVLAEVGLPLADGAAALVPASPEVRLQTAEGGLRLVGRARRVAWSEAVGTLLVEVETGDTRRVVRLSRGQWLTTERGGDLAGCRRDEVAFDTPVDQVAPTARDLRLEGAALTTLMIAGALDRVLDLSVDYVNERVQFGRPLARFQAVQHACAELAGEVAAAGAAADLAADPLGRPDGGALAVAAAKVRSGEAAGRGAAIAHQLHGALGFTAEHRLHLYTTALWAWREAFGGHAVWARRLGRVALAAGPANFWRLVTEA
jgi:acyl-CoA dehydrogenase